MQGKALSLQPKGKVEGKNLFQCTIQVFSSTGNSGCVSGGA